MDFTKEELSAFAAEMGRAGGRKGGKSLSAKKRAASRRNMLAAGAGPVPDDDTIDIPFEVVSRPNQSPLYRLNDGRLVTFAILNKLRHPNRARCRQLTKQALNRGDLVRGVCERCGSPDVHAHHKVEGDDMSRYDRPTQEPDLDRYEPKPVEDIDVPDFDQPDPPVDPAEHAAHAIIEALTTLEQQIVLTQDLERAQALRQIMNRAWTHVDLVSGKAASRVDDILERRR